MKTVLFLCTGNSCLSIMAEGILNHIGHEHFQAFSAGSFPTGTVHPKAIGVLKSHGIVTAGFRSKSWNEFGSNPFDIVITVCNKAEGESCPLFACKPIKAHWDIPDPAHHLVKIGFDGVYHMLETRIKALVRLPMEKMGRAEISEKLHQIDSLAA